LPIARETRRFFDTVGVKRFVMCEDLKYNGQRRRDVPDLGSGTLYIDVGDRPMRRKRHSFHHELWHMVSSHHEREPSCMDPCNNMRCLCARSQVDYHLLGNAFEADDPEWSQCNPPGFHYGQGGKHMRSDSSSSQVSLAWHVLERLPAHTITSRLWP
jgi:hypothetical protein